MFITGIFKLHNPSKSRKKILDHVFTDYTHLLNHLLNWSRTNLDQIRTHGLYRIIDKKTGEIKGEKYTEKSIMSLLPKPSELKNYDIAACLREAAISNTAAMLASYLMLDSGEQQQAGFPIGRDPSPEGYPNALDQFCTLYLQNLPETPKLEHQTAETEARARLMRITRVQHMPVHIIRARDFALLWDEQKDRYFVWLKLLPNKSPASPQEPTVINQDNLIDINTGKPLKYKGRSAFLFPIELGRRNDNWHWQYQKFIKPTMEGQADIKTAKLVRSPDGEYFIHISFDVDIPAPYTPQAYLGVNRGIIHSVGYGIIDLEGRIIETGHSDDPFMEFQNRARKRVQNRQKRAARITKKDYATQELDNIIHTVVNQLLDLAHQHHAALVLEDWSLTNTGKFYRSAYEKINGIITYKAELRGVPIVKRKIWSAYASQICIHCGHPITRDERIVTCLNCGQIGHVDEYNGINIARRVLYKKEQWGGTKDQPGDWRKFHMSFSKFM